MAYWGRGGRVPLRSRRRRIYHAGDTGLTVEMGLLAEDGVDVALLPIGGNYTMDIDDAVRAVRIKNPGWPSDAYNTFPLIKASPRSSPPRLRARGDKDPETRGILKSDRRRFSSGVLQPENGVEDPSRREGTPTAPPGLPRRVSHVDGETR